MKYEIVSDFKKRAVVLLWCLAVSLFLWYFSIGMSDETPVFQFVNFSILLFGGGFAYHIVSLLVICPYNDGNTTCWNEIMKGLLRVYLGYVVAGAALFTGKGLGNSTGWLVAFLGLILGMFLSFRYLMKLEPPLRQLLFSSQNVQREVVMDGSGASLDGGEKEVDKRKR